MPSRPHAPRRARLYGGAGALLALVAAAAGCGSKAPDVTGLIVVVSFPDVTANQLEVSVATPAGAEILSARRRPETAGAPLPSTQSIAIYLRDDLADQDVICTVKAIAADRGGATGSATARLVRRKLVQVDVTLTAATGDGAVADDAADAGDGAADGPADGGDGSPDAGDGGLKANGQPCDVAAECESTLCVDNLCCASACDGLCETCSLPGKEGTCSPRPAGAASACADQGPMSCGYDGKCDGSGKCQQYLAGTACKAAACLAGMYVPMAACDGQGTCKPAKNVDCAPYACDTTGGPPACRTTCRAGQADCVAPAVCAAASCGTIPKKQNGAGCIAGTDCLSAICADGVCCGAPCAGACQACNLTGMEGMCLNVGMGKTDPHAKCADKGAATCGTNGLCDGAGGCQVYPASTTCAPGSCSGHMVRNAKRCDGKGTCAAAPDLECLPYRCDPATTACFSSCTTNAQCSQAPRRTCNNAGACGN